MKINAGSVVCDRQYLCRTTNQNCALDVNGHKARQHDNDLEHVGPDHGFHSTLLTDDKGDRNRE